MERAYYICENAPEFCRPDPQNADFAFGEVDVYAHDPTAPPGGDHRLSIRRCLRPDEREWQLYRAAHGGTTEIVAHGTLAEVCLAANREWMRAWARAMRPGERHAGDAPCTHRDGARSLRCGAQTREDLDADDRAEQDRLAAEGDAQAAQEAEAQAKEEYEREMEHEPPEDDCLG
jgi:hypothetical protein